MKGIEGKTSRFEGKSIPEVLPATRPQGSLKPCARHQVKRLHEASQQ